jgi:hypothetical protein
VFDVVQLQQAPALELCAELRSEVAIAFAALFGPENTGLLSHFDSEPLAGAREYCARNTADSLGMPRIAEVSMSARSSGLPAVAWATMEDHTVRFRNSEAFSKWREIVGPHFSKAPQVKHLEHVYLGF